MFHQRISRAVASVAILALVVSGANRAGAASECSVSAIDPISFGSYVPKERSRVVTHSAVTVTCSRPTQFTIGLDGGRRGSIEARGMVSTAGHVLLYQLFSDPAMTRIWGDGSHATTFNVPNSRPVSIPVYAVLYAGQSAPAGQYTDEINGKMLVTARVAASL